MGVVHAHKTIRQDLKGKDLGKSEASLSHTLNSKPTLGIQQNSTSKKKKYSLEVSGDQQGHTLPNTPRRHKNSACSKSSIGS